MNDLTPAEAELVVHLRRALEVAQREFAAAFAAEDWETAERWSGIANGLVAATRQTREPDQTA